MTLLDRLYFSIVRSPLEVLEFSFARRPDTAAQIVPMCGRLVLVKIEIDGGYIWTQMWVGPEDFQDKDWYKKKISEIRARYDIRPTQDVVIMKAEKKTKGIEMPRTKWGWQVPWMKAPLINARSESLLESRTWRAAIRDRRCIIPGSAFYEWQRRPGEAKPRPWEIKKKGVENFFLAGLWKDAVDAKTGEPVLEATLITQPGNSLLRSVHNHGGNAGRQPVFLDDDKIGPWLDPAMNSAANAIALLRQIEDGEWEGRMLEAIGNDSSHTAPVPLSGANFITKPDVDLSGYREETSSQEKRTKTTSKKALNSVKKRNK